MSKKLAGIIVACIIVVIVVIFVVVPRLAPPAEPTYNLTIDSTEGGAVTMPDEGTSAHKAGVVVDLVASPAGDHVFVDWTGDVDTIADTTSANTTITMNGDYTITANFEAEELPPVEYTLTIDSGDGGEVTDPGEGTFTFEAGTVVDLVADPAGGYVFVDWTGDVDTIDDTASANTTITMNGDYSIKANFLLVHPIQNWYDLHAIRDNLDGNYRLMNDLHSGTAGYGELAGPGADGGKGWQPIGTWADRFAGSFDGQGYEIRGLSIDRPDEVYVALFGYVGSGGVVVNVEVMHMGITGHEAVGGLVGSNEGTVTNCGATGSVSGSNYVGGLMGINVGAVRSSYSIGSAIGTGNEYLGGLVGWNDGTVTDCGSLTTVKGYNLIGGLVGFNSGTVNSSYAAGSVTGIGQYVEGQVPVGGLVGRNDAKGIVSNSFWDVETSGMEESDGGTGKTTAELTDIATFTDTATEGLDVPWNITAVDDFDARDTAFVWNIVDGVSWPFHSWRAYLI